jgi:hypothetical protein
MTKKNSKTPLHEISDGYYFQQIVAEYFRSLKKERQDFHISDIDVYNSGVGSDNGCDILVDFHFEDAIGKHTQRWVVECKSKKRNVGNSDLNLNNLSAIIKSKKANGYLLVCISDATTSLQELMNCFKEEFKIEIWNGTQLWRKLVGIESIIKSYFPDYYNEKFIINNAKKDFENAFNNFEKQIEQ